MEDPIVKLLRENLRDGLLSAETPRERKVSANMSPRVIKKAAEAMVNKGARFVTIAAVDTGLSVELLYHFDLAGTVAVLKAEVPKEAPEIESIANLIPAAGWAEREAADLFGVSFKGHPKPERLVLPDDWPKDNRPLGKPFKPKIAEEVSPVAESIIAVGATAPITTLMERRRTEAGLAPQPPASYSNEAQLKEVHELAKQTSFSEQAGYDWERKKLRGARK